jgi:hypothetical protein
MSAAIAVTAMHFPRELRVVEAPESLGQCPANGMAVKVMPRTESESKNLLRLPGH